ncbi:MAG: response regulator transcription factor, partial [Streptomycetaceae bacterium]|nr:response regulator transcription factor [Streptomycetaceae bacterium]
MTASPALRVLLAEDEPLIRAGVRAVLATDPGIEVVAEAEDGAEAVELARRHRPDVAVLDIRMPRMDGLAATAEIRRLLPDTAVVVLTTFGEDAYIAQAIDGGATGFLLKSGDPRELLTGIRAAAEGAAYLSPRVAKRVIDNLGQPVRTSRAAERVAVLTAREREVLALLGEGL